MVESSRDAESTVFSSWVESMIESPSERTMRRRGFDTPANAAGNSFLMMRFEASMVVKDICHQHRYG
jgi:hypothetical protein